MKTKFLLSINAVFLSLSVGIPTLAFGSPYFVPPNVLPPAKEDDSAAFQPERDLALPLIYIEPHDFCFDAGDSLNVTVYAVNRGTNKLKVDWQDIFAGLVLKSLGPGVVKPRPQKLATAEAEVPPHSFAKATLDLRSQFEVQGASVFSIEYRRLLADGRTHIGSAVQFVMEDDQALKGFVESTLPENHPLRATALRLLTDNPVFALGCGAKTYGWDALNWRDQPEMSGAIWIGSLASAEDFWLKEVGTISGNVSQQGFGAVEHLLLDRLMTLSNGFACRFDPSRRFYHSMQWRWDAATRDENVQFQMKLARSHDPWVVGTSLNRLCEIKSPEALDLVISIADGKDRELARQALSGLSNYASNEKVNEFLKRKMKDADPHLALKAAIMTCYSGDGSGFPMILEYVRHKDPTVRIQAIGQLVDDRFAYRHAQVVPLLLERLKVESDPALIDRTIESLGNYPSALVLEAIRPFLKHGDESVRGRAKLVVARVKPAVKSR